MGKKYYFRGLGLGIIVTALIMGIALSRDTKREMTDAEIIARAKELGMTENTRLVEPSETDENQEETEPSPQKETVTEPVKKDVAVAKPQEDVGEPSKDGKESSEEQPADQAQSEPQEKPEADTNEMTKQDEDTGQEETPPTEESPEDTSQQQTASAVSITIVSGDGSYTVAKKLEEAGVVFSASDYDDYLCQNGYDKRLRTGTFQIPKGASNEQIAKIVTSQP